MGAFSAGAFYGIGSAFQMGSNSNYMAAQAGSKGVYDFGGQFLTAGQIAGKIGLHALAGGTMSVLQGGRFGHGFAAAGVTQSFASQIGGLDQGQRFSLKRIAAAAVLGGTVSKVSGGKFANGAATGAFSRAFNDEAVGHRMHTDSQLEVAIYGHREAALPIGHRLCGCSFGN